MKRANKKKEDPTPKKRKKPSVKLTRTTKYLEQPTVDAVLDESIECIKTEYANLLKHKEGWTISPEVRAELLTVNQGLVLRFMHRCSLFAMHRTNTRPETMEKAKVVLTREDVDMAWQTLSMDEQRK